MIIQQRDDRYANDDEARRRQSNQPGRYTRPVLVVYGQLPELTHAISGKTSDTLGGYLEGT